MWILTGVILYWHAIKKIDTSGPQFTVHYNDGQQELLTDEQSKELRGAITQMAQPQPTGPGRIPLIG